MCVHNIAGKHSIFHLVVVFKINADVFYSIIENYKKSLLMTSDVFS